MKNRLILLISILCFGQMSAIPLRWNNLSRLKKVGVGTALATSAYIGNNGFEALRRALDYNGIIKEHNILEKLDGIIYGEKYKKQVAYMPLVSSAIFQTIAFKTILNSKKPLITAIPITLVQSFANFLTTCKIKKEAILESERHGSMYLTPEERNIRIEEYSKHEIELTANNLEISKKDHQFIVINNMLNTQLYGIKRLLWLIHGKPTSEELKKAINNPSLGTEIKVEWKSKKN